MKRLLCFLTGLLLIGTVNADGLPIVDSLKSRALLSEPYADIVANHLMEQYNAGGHETLPANNQFQLDVSNINYVQSVTNDSSGAVIVTVLALHGETVWIKLWPISSLGPAPDFDKQVHTFTCTTNIDSSISGLMSVTPGQRSSIIASTSGMYFDCTYETQPSIEPANYLPL